MKVPSFLHLTLSTLSSVIRRQHFEQDPPRGFHKEARFLFCSTNSYHKPLLFLLCQIKTPLAQQLTWYFSRPYRFSNSWWRWNFSSSPLSHQANGCKYPFQSCSEELFFSVLVVRVVLMCCVVWFSTVNNAEYYGTCISAYYSENVPESWFFLDNFSLASV